MAYYFELPTFTDLTNNQRLALEEEEYGITLSGGPGTGKTVVSLWRHIRNYELNQRKSLLLTYTKTLEHYLRLTASKQDANASNNIARTYNWTFHNKNNGQHYDEIIIDEAQDVELEKYTTIKRLSDMVSFGADDAQKLYQKGCSLSDLEELFPNNEEFELEQNFRNSREILEFTKAVFPNIYISDDIVQNARLTLRKPYVQEIGWGDDFEECVVDNIIEITEDFSESTHNIGILVPFVRMVKKYYDLLSDRVDCSMYCNKMPTFKDLNRVHITTFKSAKGLEFDTVIIPEFDSYTRFIENYSIVSENDYYVALTRSKINLFLLCKNGLNNIDTTTYELEDN